MRKFWNALSTVEIRDLVRSLRKRRIFHKHVHPYNTRISKQKLIQMLHTKFHVKPIKNRPGQWLISSRRVDFHFVYARGLWFRNQSFEERL